MPLSKEEIARRKAQATGQPSTAVAQRQAGGLMIPERLQEFVGEQLSREMVIAAISQPSWRKAIDEGGIEAVAQALYICLTERLQPHRGHVFVFKPEQSGPHQAMVTAYGYATIAGRKVDNRGVPLFQGIRFDESEEVERGPDGEEETYVKVKAYVHWQGGGYSEGEGRKPRHMKLKGGARKWDKDAEGKAETMAARRAFQVSPFASSLPLDDAPALEEEPRPPIRVEQEPPAALAAGVGPPRDYPRTNTDGDPSVAPNMNQALAQEPDPDEPPPAGWDADDNDLPGPRRDGTIPGEPTQGALADVEAAERKALRERVVIAGVKALGGIKGLAYFLQEETGAEDGTNPDLILDDAALDRLQEWAEALEGAAQADAKG
jgi:hypothetical protein